MSTNDISLVSGSKQRTKKDLISMLSISWKCRRILLYNNYNVGQSAENMSYNFTGSKKNDSITMLVNQLSKCPRHDKKKQWSKILEQKASVRAEMVGGPDPREANICWQHDRKNNGQKSYNSKPPSGPRWSGARIPVRQIYVEDMIEKTMVKNPTTESLRPGRDGWGPGSPWGKYI